MRTALFALALVPMSLLGVDAAPFKVIPTKTWKGSVENETLMRGAPTVIVSQKSLDALWETWKQADKAPQVDFAKEIVVIAVSSGSSINLALQRNEANLKVLGFGTFDLRPGFRFVMGSVDRAGITTINGLAMPKE